MTALELSVEFIQEFCEGQHKEIIVGESGATAFYNGLPTTTLTVAALAFPAALAVWPLPGGPAPGRNG